MNIKVCEKAENDKWLVELQYDGDLLAILERIGTIPLPPYIKRKVEDNKVKSFDFKRYQTVYAKDPASVAAPTAGLHFTPELINKIKEKGIKVCNITLNVGLGTFKPVKANNIIEHKMDKEFFEIEEDTVKIITEAKSKGNKI